MGKTFTPIVITSRKARKELNRIKTHASDIVKNLEEHKKKVSDYHLKSMNEAFAKAKDKQEREAKDRQEIQAHVKELMAQRLKEKELELKRQALSNG